MTQLKTPSGEYSFHLSNWQKLFAFLTLLVLIAMTFSTFNASQVSAKQSVILTAAEKSSDSIISTQREALEYIVEIKQWSQGALPKSSVEASRDILTKHLYATDSNGMTLSGLVDPLFLQALKEIDVIIQRSPQGFLTDQIQASTRAQIEPISEKIAEFATQLVISFQRNIEVKLREVTMEREKITTRNLWLRFLLLFMIFILISWVGASFSARYKSIQNSIKTQLDELALSRAELGVALLAITELKVLDDEKNEFISNINHELRTPLTSIIGYLGLVNDLTDEEKNPKIAKFLKIVDRNLLSLLDLVENMLTISKLEVGANPKVFKRIMLDEIIADAIFVLQPSLDAAAISIEFVAENSYDNSHDDWSIAGNRGQISQVFINLFQNSVKFSPRNSKIFVGIVNIFDKTGAKFVRVSVSDHGMGISAEDMKKLFHRFFRSESAVHAQIPGTGLGLSIVKKIVEQHGGRIEVESEINIGTTVHIELPVYVRGMDQLIQERRLPVLEKAIESITNAPLDELQEIADEMGGAIASYTLKKEGAELINFSKWLADSPNLTEEEIVSKRNTLLLKLKMVLVKIELGLSNNVD
ncbi:MAG: HAMP domain-containing sensor histidine kinase [Candidatus Planktophila sp.]|nr:HAMP domain-containing sensor histidine kinase [Candidatus Planktophila sp.]